jgi:hypothetical protein
MRLTKRFLEIVIYQSLLGKQDLDAKLRCHYTGLESLPISLLKFGKYHPRKQQQQQQ